VGDLKLKWHRPLPADAQIKTVTAKRAAERWYVCFSVEMPDPQPLPASDLAVGIDVGLTTFAVLSDGAEIANRVTSEPPSDGCGSPNASWRGGRSVRIVG